MNCAHYKRIIKYAAYFTSAIGFKGFYSLEVFIVERIVTFCAVGVFVNVSIGIKNWQIFGRKLFCCLDAHLGRGGVG